HGTTFGGNPLATATALAVLETIESENLLANVNEVGQYLANKLRGLSSIKTVRAYGLWQGIELDTELLTQQGQTLPAAGLAPKVVRSEEHTYELMTHLDIVCCLLLDT